MPMQILNESVSFGISIPLHNFTDLANAHIQNVNNTLQIEIDANNLIQGGFQDNDIAHFINSVCQWGNYYGIAARVLNNNTFNEIRQAFNNALIQIDAQPSNICEALTNVNSLYGLGQPSFASKHLRFLRPQKCPVFDSVLHEALPYSFNAHGYALFAADCLTLAEYLSTNQINNPFRNNNLWYVADVEAAIFSFCNEH